MVMIRLLKIIPIVVLDNLPAGVSDGCMPNILWVLQGILVVLGVSWGAPTRKWSDPGDGSFDCPGRGTRGNRALARNSLRKVTKKRTYGFRQREDQEAVRATCMINCETIERGLR